MLTVEGMTAEDAAAKLGVPVRKLRDYASRYSVRIAKPRAVKQQGLDPYLKFGHLPNWRIAEELGVTAAAVSRMKSRHPHIFAPREDRAAPLPAEKVREQDIRIAEALFDYMPEETAMKIADRVDKGSDIRAAFAKVLL